MGFFDKNEEIIKRYTRNSRNKKPIENIVIPETFKMALESLKNEIKSLNGVPEKTHLLNHIKKELHQISPFKGEPVDCVIWEAFDKVHANDYNPNAVAPPEMELLKHSILEDGFTQPIVTWPNANKIEVIDGFHRNRVGKECKEVSDRIQGFLPVVVINSDRQSRNDRIAATIRHNRARGKHSVDSMSDIVIELKKRNWSDNRISKELGMDPDEILRLCQVSGLVEVFCDTDFNEAWEAEIFAEDDFQALDEEDLE